MENSSMPFFSIQWTMTTPSWSKVSGCPPNLSRGAACAAQLHGGIGTEVAKPHLPFLWSPSLGGALFLAAEMLIGRCKLESALLRARWSWPPSYPACSGSATAVWDAKQSRSPRAGQESIVHARATSCSHHRCWPLGPVTLGKGTEHQCGARKARGKCTASALESQFCWADKWWLPQLCWECEYFAVVPAPNRLQHKTAVLVYFDHRDTNWCQHKVTHSQSIHRNAYLGSSEIITVILTHTFKALQLINVHRLIYNPDSVLGTGKASGVIKLKTVTGTYYLTR